MCKETFFLTSDTPVCAGAVAGAGNFAICNHSTRNYEYKIAFDGLKEDECDVDVDVDGPDYFQLLPPHA